jgi:hypothetical protein
LSLPEAIISPEDLAMRLVLTPEQTQKLASATDTVVVVDAAGHTVGEFTMDLSHTETKTLSADELAEVRRQIKEANAANGSSFTARQVCD